MTLAKFRIVVAGILISLYRVFTTLFFDIRTVINKWRGLPYFFQTLWEYVKKNRNQSAFKIQLRSFQPVLHERYEEAGTANGHYFWQNLWAFEFLKSAKVTEVIDDSGEGVKRNASLTEVSKRKYGRGLFVFVNHER